nr:unnamed protein product [Callosobruchus analis]
MDLVETVFTECEETPESTGQLDHGLLIEAIQGYPYLYDMSDKLYKNNKKKAEAWEVIADTLNCTGKSAKRMNENLPNTFLEVAKQIIEKIDTKQRTNPNRTFCDYLFCELEKLTEGEAKEKRKQILNNVFWD